MVSKSGTKAGGRAHGQRRLGKAPVQPPCTKSGKVPEPPLIKPLFPKLGSGVTSPQISKKRGEKTKPTIPSEYRALIKASEDTTDVKDQVLEKTYVLDANVLIDDGYSIFKFDEHSLCIVSQVWDELDASKEGLKAKAYNTRKATRFIDELTQGKTDVEIAAGVLLTPPVELRNGKPHTGKLFLDFTLPKIPEDMDVALSHERSDDRVLMSCLALKKAGKRVVLVSRDINFRIKARSIGIEAEDYLSDTAKLASKDSERLGYHYVPSEVWDAQGDNLQSEFMKNENKVRYRLTHPFFEDVYPNEFLIFPDGLKMIVRSKLKSREQKVIAETVVDYTHKKVWGILPKNTQQGLAMQLLMDPKIPGVALSGPAGSGKTILTLAAALHLTYDLRRYDKIIVTRSLVNAAEDIGFLPGDEEEKVKPWMGAIQDSLEVLQGADSSDDTPEMKKAKAGSTDFFLQGRLSYKTLNFMRGRSFLKTFIIVDEAQNLTPDMTKMIATRVGEGSKIVFLGNVAQIDSPYLTEHTCGLTILVNKLLPKKEFGYVLLPGGVRSAFATVAEELL